MYQDGAPWSGIAASEPDDDRAKSLLLADGKQDHERPGLPRSHLGPVVGDGEQDGGGVIVEVDVAGGVEAPLEVDEEPFGVETARNTTLTWVPVCSAHNRLAIH